MFRLLIFESFDTDISSLYWCEFLGVDGETVYRSKIYYTKSKINKIASRMFILAKEILNSNSRMEWVKC